MDVKALTDEELSQLQQDILVEIENRRAAAAAPALIQQTAARALSAGASKESLFNALDRAINPQSESNLPPEGLDLPPQATDRPSSEP